MSEKEKTSGMNAATSNPMKLGKKNIHKVTGDSNMVLVESKAAWSGSCQFMLLTFDKLSNRYDGNMSFVKETANVNQGRGER